MLGGPKLIPSDGTRVVYQLCPACQQREADKQDARARKLIAAGVTHSCLRIFLGGDRRYSMVVCMPRSSEEQAELVALGIIDEPNRPVAMPMSSDTEEVTK